MRHALLASGLVLATCGTGAAQEVRTCYGTDNCTVVSPSGARQLSVEEARRRAREDARNELQWEVAHKCDIAIDPARCRELVRELAAPFGPGY